MGLEIRPFDPAGATQTDIAEYRDLSEAVFAVDRPDEPPPTLAEIAVLLPVVMTNLGPKRIWMARRDGQLVGLVLTFTPDAENSHMAITEVRVPPVHRRQGIGTALLREVLPYLGAEGRRLVNGVGALARGSGEKWATSLGFVVTHEWVKQTLAVPDVDPTLWDVPVPPGFRLVDWVSAAPESLVASVARARGAISDAPRGEGSRRSPDWTVEHVRRTEADLREHGVEQRVVAAVHETTGQVAGLTELEIRPGNGNSARQQDTVVLTEFRGHGLGRCLKAAMMRRLLDGHPEIQRVTTTTSADNTHMIRVNHQVGYTTTREITEVVASVEELTARLT